jgi:hypothetical protein
MRFVAYFPRALSDKEVLDFLYRNRHEESMSREVCGICWVPYGDDGKCGCPPCATQDCMPSKCSLAAQNTEQDRVLVEMEHALNEADAIIDDDQEAYEWRKRWGYLWGRKV